MQVRFSAERAATGDWRVDDALVDPRNARLGQPRQTHGAVHGAASPVAE
jgi:hypothetical protein